MGSSRQTGAQKPRCLSLDIDGTLADISARLAFGEPKTGPDYWDTVLDGDLYTMDVPIPQARYAVWAWLQEGDANACESRPSRCVVYVSGRRAGTEEQTCAWLRKHGFPDGTIHHRTKGWSSMLWKRDVLRKLKRSYYVVAHVGDSKDDFKAAKAAGLRCVHVQENQWITERAAQAQGVADLHLQWITQRAAQAQDDPRLCRGDDPRLCRDHEFCSSSGQVDTITIDEEAKFGNEFRKLPDSCFSDETPASPNSPEGSRRHVCGCWNGIFKSLRQLLAVQPQKAISSNVVHSGASGLVLADDGGAC